VTYFPKFNKTGEWRVQHISTNQWSMCFWKSMWVTARLNQVQCYDDNLGWPTNISDHSQLLQKYLLQSKPSQVYSADIKWQQ